MITPIYSLSEAAELIGVSDEWLRSKLRDHTFAGLKRAGRWAMTEPQIEHAIEAMSTEARPVEKPSPAGLARNSKFRRRIERRSA
ncbi:hypothetical protein NIIDNTM18_42860 [Mycolicibacterium litorale]|uniref:Helix-turn-helix domain-containing protein n=1 Tax=Mycolicibacterium litorale TaxID=758802 RepID=A0A6S6PGA0_9MYCO|nr:hypothetical protein NIIDNTM18_42860 [Mycolicibacterium litorale]